MDSCDRYLGLRWKFADEIDIHTISKDPTRFGLDKQFGNIAGRQPVFIGSHNRHHVGGLALDGYLSGPGQRRPAAFTGLRERSSVFCHLFSRETAQDGLWQDLL